MLTVSELIASMKQRESLGLDPLDRRADEETTREITAAREEGPKLMMQPISETGVVHFLKCWPGPFAAVVDYFKPYEIREDDRNYQVGDVLVLREWASGNYTGRHVARLVTYKTNGGEWRLPTGLCVLGMCRAEVPCHPSYFTEGSVKLSEHVRAMREAVGTW